jgi:hypothetical protein
MVSDKWKAERPQVTSYIPKEIHEQLKAFKDEKEISSMAKAVETIVTEYFSGRVDSPLPSQSADNVELIALKQEVQSLRTIIHELVEVVHKATHADLTELTQKAELRPARSKNNLKSASLNEEAGSFLPNEKPEVDHKTTHAKPEPEWMTNWVIKEQGILAPRATREAGSSPGNEPERENKQQRRPVESIEKTTHNSNQETKPEERLMLPGSVPLPQIKATRSIEEETRLQTRQSSKKQSPTAGWELPPI